MNFRKIEKVELLVRPRVRRGHTDSTAALVLERIFDVANWHPRANHGAPDQERAVRINSFKPNRP